MSEREWALVGDGGDVSIHWDEGSFPATYELHDAEELHAQLGEAIEEAKKRKKKGPFEKWWESLQRCRCGNPSCEVRLVNGLWVSEGQTRGMWESVQKAMKEEE